MSRMNDETHQHYREEAKSILLLKTTGLVLMNDNNLISFMAVQLEQLDTLKRIEQLLASIEECAPDR